MKTRNFVLSALGLAAAFTFGGAETASAQKKATTKTTKTTKSTKSTRKARSTTRIPVSKEGDKAPMMAKVDTVYITRRDTVTIRGRTDTVTVRMRPDTVMQMMMAPLATMPQMQFGIGGGVAVPSNDWRNSTKDGPAAHAHFSFFPGAGPLGIRLAGDAAFLAHRETDCKGCPDPKVYTGSADLVYRIPIDQRGNLNPVLYVLGGGGIDKFSDFLAYQADQDVVTGGSNTYAPFYAGPPFPYTGGAKLVTAANRGDKSLFYHYDAGAGMEFGRGDIRFFFEGKYVTINTQATKGSNYQTGGGTTAGSHNSHYFPIIAGINFSR